jgi:hypothetical protein
VTYADFAAAHPELDGYTPGCGWCQHLDDGGLPQAGYCRIANDGVLRPEQHDCDVGAFSFDARPPAERWPAHGAEYWEKGEKYGTAFRLKMAKQHGQGVNMGGLLFVPTPGTPLAPSEYPTTTEDTQ